MQITPSHDTALLTLHYLPCVQYFSTLVRYQYIYIEKCEHYTKGSYRNRAYIASANGKLALSIPLSKGKNQQQPITEVAISYTQPWHTQHWQSIQSAYGKSPFFEFYKDDLSPIFLSKPADLFTLNLTLLETIIELMGLPIELQFTTSYNKEVPKNWIDLREAIHPKRSQPDPFFTPSPYNQLFEERHGFLPNLSILDVLFCLGPEAIMKL